VKHTSTIGENTTPGTHEIVADWVFEQAGHCRVLDIPSGEGAFTKRCLAQGLQVVSADCEPMCAVPEATFSQVDMNCPLPHEEDSFDTVVCIDGIEHIERPFDFAEECARVLRPGGSLVVTTPNITSLRSRWRWLLTGFHNKCRSPLNEANPNPLHHINMLSFHKLRYMLHRSGFTITKIGTNRIKPISLAYAWLLPMAYVATWWTLRTAEKDPQQSLRNREIIRQMFSKEILFGETMIIMARNDKPSLAARKAA
jgi:2-polyprenyl-3-methyl-5-hydroxy-6-metoxy-1,4-benzoquinol methylase